MTCPDFPEHDQVLRLSTRTRAETGNPGAAGSKSAGYDPDAGALQRPHYSDLCVPSQNGGFFVRLQPHSHFF